MNAFSKKKFQSRSPSKSILITWFLGENSDIDNFSLIGLLADKQTKNKRLFQHR